MYVLSPILLVLLNSNHNLATTKFKPNTICRSFKKFSYGMCNICRISTRSFNEYNTIFVNPFVVCLIESMFVAWMSKMLASLTPLSILCFTCFVNAKNNQKPPIWTKWIWYPRCWQLRVWECRMRKTINNTRWENPSFWGIWCYNFHSNIVQHACKTKSTRHKP